MAMQTPGTSVHWYGKQVQNKRKLGHITITGTDNQEAQQRLRSIDPAAADAMDAASHTFLEAAVPTKQTQHTRGRVCSSLLFSCSRHPDADFMLGHAVLHCMEVCCAVLYDLHLFCASDKEVLHWICINLPVQCDVYAQHVSVSLFAFTCVMLATSGLDCHCNVLCWQLGQDCACR